MSAVLQSAPACIAQRRSPLNRACAQRLAMSWLKDLRATGQVEEPLVLWQDVLLSLELTPGQQVRPDPAV